MTSICRRTCTRRDFAKAAFVFAWTLAAPALLSGCSKDEPAADEGQGESAADEKTEANAGTSPEVQTRTLFVFDTVVQLSAQCSPELMDQLAERCAFFEQKLSRTVEGSDIWNVNHAQGAPVEVCAETAQVIRAAVGYSRASGGLFDITVGGVSSLWDFASGVKPTDEAVKAALPHVGYRNISLDGNTVTLADPETMLDLGGIAKGFITDDLVRMLREGGCKSASLSLGGNVYVMGKSYDGDAWNVGVQDPNGAADSVVASIPAEDASLVTSGLYERSFEEDGALYHHILDPRTGYPVKTDLASASIMSASSTDGDAYSTILFLMGHDAAMELVEEDERFEALLVDESGRVSTSEGSRFSVAHSEAESENENESASTSTGSGA